MKTRMITAAAVLALSATSAAASDFYFGGSTGYTKSSGLYDSEYTDGDTVYSGSNTLDFNGAVKSAFIGTRGFKISDKTSIGAELEFTRFGGGATKTITNGFNTATLSMNNSADAKLMIFHDLSEKTTVFLGAGVSSGSFNWGYNLNDYNHKPNTRRNLRGGRSYRSTGVVVQAGVEHKISKKVSIRAVVTHRRYGKRAHGSVDLSGQPFGYTYTGDYGSASSSTSAMVGLVFKF